MSLSISNMTWNYIRQHTKDDEFYKKINLSPESFRPYWTLFWLQSWLPEMITGWWGCCHPPGLSLPICMHNGLNTLCCHSWKCILHIFFLDDVILLNRLSKFSINTDKKEAPVFCLHLCTVFAVAFAPFWVLFVFQKTKDARVSEIYSPLRLR